MDENYNGKRYYIFDGAPVKTIWQDGIIIEVYSIDVDKRIIIRKDRLAFYVEKEISEKDNISKEEYLKHVAEVFQNLTNYAKIRNAIEEHKDTLDRLADL